jgi:nucleoside-diphosphate-sugar epimerase
MHLVTGGAGFIGSHLVDELVSRGYRVRVLDNLSTGSRANLMAVQDQIEFIEGDILDRRAVRAAMDGIEIVYHQAAMRSVPRSIDDPAATNRSNVDGTLNVLLAARDAGVRRVVYASSSSVYGDSPSLPLREDDPARPVSPYAASKLAGEHYCRVFTRVYGLSTVSLRYFNVFGPRQDPGSQYAVVIPRFIHAALSGQPLEIHGDGLQSRDFTPVRNIVLANSLAADARHASGEVFNVACGTQYRLLDIVEWLSRRLGQHRPPVRWYHTQPRAGDVRHTLADIGKAMSILGYRPLVGMGEGLEDLFTTLATPESAQACT